ncbi:MAG: septal ring lytic transglycosylase RlpA family protein, partial [Erysipelotrichia bacterium]|nr:septal ring lytic transglycosylase RlpA family protein [Erysipelotrichia bacterium]
KTSNGEIYNMHAMTAAHKTLPMNTVVRVDNLENGKSIIVRINDRGPFVKGRIIDLSNKAAHEIDMVRRGTAKVKVTVLGYNGEIQNKNAPFDQVSKENIPPQSESIVELEPLDIKEDKIVSTSVTAPTIGATVTKPLPVINNKPKANVVSSGNYKIQVGAFSKIDGATKTKNDYQRKFGNNLVEYEKSFVNGNVFYKVFIKGFKSYDEALRFKNNNGLNNSMILK